MQSVAHGLPLASSKHALHFVIVPGNRKHVKPQRCPADPSEAAPDRRAGEPKQDGAQDANLLKKYNLLVPGVGLDLKKKK
jgi:hypothetical protein